VHVSKGIAAALKTIKLLQNGLTENARIVGNYLKYGFIQLQEKYDCIEDVRGIVESKQTPQLRDQRGLLLFYLTSNKIHREKCFQFKK